MYFVGTKSVYVLLCPLPGSVQMTINLVYLKHHSHMIKMNFAYVYNAQTGVIV